ncbi:hypothetical protein [Spirosoma sp.]|uniref:hypothetical protein n=1 Tax=Spirosoma sp. TaxID=1899569 RepID=UPI0026183B64|nr:hypothetical protein [Spirosoma sp.]MCX6214609.1 hypothetical protein [Spirosoma sp.]
MKTTTRFRTLLTAMTLSVGVLTSCQKETVVADDPTRGFSADIRKIVPDAIINDLRSRGMVINEGKVPPKLNGTFRASPYTLLSPYGSDDSFEAGDVINDYVYKFYGQNTTNAISYDYTNYSSDTGTGKGAFVAGNGTLFTIFSEDTGIARGVPYKTVSIISGEVTAGGIRNFQYAFVVKEKTGDAGDQTLIPVNTGRIWLDGDKLATTDAGGRIGVPMREAVSQLTR